MGGRSTNKIKIYSYDKIFDTAMKRLQSASDICNDNKTSIIRLVETLLTKGISKQRAVKYINHLTVLARMTSKPFDQLGKEDVEKLVVWINTASYTEHTKHDYKVILKKFYQWLRGCSEDEGEYPEEVRWIKTNFRHKRLLPEALLTVKEIRKLVEVTENQRDRALILTQYESGCRIGETLSLRILNVCFDQHGAALIVNGKTGPRRVRVIAAAPALASWLNIHPLRSDPNAPLWVGIGTVGRYEPLDYNGARALLRRLAKNACLNKRLYSHLMRHTRATELANILTEAQMKEFLGWVQSSDMPSVYVHLSGRDVDGALLKAHGIIINQEDDAKMEITSIVCPRCKQKVGPEGQFCSVCGMVLDLKTAVKLEEDKLKANQIMDMLMKDEEVRNLLMKKIRELHSSSQPLPTS